MTAFKKILDVNVKGWSQLCTIRKQKFIVVTLENKKLLNCQDSQA